MFSIYKWFNEYHIVYINNHGRNYNYASGVLYYAFQLKNRFKSKANATIYKNELNKNFNF